MVGPLDAIMHAGRRLTGQLGQTPGFVAYVVLDAVNGALTSVTVYASQAELEEGRFPWKHEIPPARRPVARLRGAGVSSRAHGHLRSPIDAHR